MVGVWGRGELGGWEEPILELAGATPLDPQGAPSPPAGRTGEGCIEVLEVELRLERQGILYLTEKKNQYQ